MAPQLRGLLQRQLYRDLGTGLVLAVFAGAAWRYGYALPKRKKYEEFYKNYDAEKVAKEIEADVAALNGE